MSTSELIFLVIGVGALLLLALGLVVGEFDVDGDAPELDAGGDIDSPSWHDLKVLLAGFVGFGAGGYTTINTSGSTAFSWFMACVGFFAVATFIYHAILKPLHAQQHNSLLNRRSYVGKEAVVVITVSPEQDGLVEFVDDNGSIVRQSARSDAGTLPTGSRTLIFDLSDTGVLVMSPDNLQRPMSR